MITAEALACVLDLTLGTAGAVAGEERLNARAAAMIACGHADPETLLALQYQTFCGGCTADALAAAPLMTLLGPTVATWKLIPMAAHLGVTALGALLARRAAPLGDRAAVIFVALMIGAPAFYRDLWWTAWGNHAESALFPLAAAALLGVSRSPRRWLALPAALLAGALAGLGVWYAYIAAHALPALIAMAALTGRGRLAAFTLGLPLGLAPWWLSHQASTSDGRFETLLTIAPAPPAELGRWLWSDFVNGGLWPEAGLWGPGLPSAAVWGALAACALVGMALSLRDTKMDWGVDRGAASFAPAALLALLLAYALRHDLWSDSFPLDTYDFFNLRYRAPLMVLIALGAALAAGRPGRVGAAAALIVATAAGFGGAQRTTTWLAGPRAPLDVRVAAPDGAPDPTVPSGEPRQRNPWQQGRDADLDAAVAFLAEHTDPLPDCRRMHIGELGRRAGVGLSGDAVSGERVVALAAATAPADRRALYDGLGHGLSRRTPSLALTEKLSPLDGDPQLAAEVAAAVGRHLAGRLTPAEAEQSGLDARIIAGLCEADGADWLRETLRGASRGAGTLSAPATTCPHPSGWWAGVGWAWAGSMGCEDTAALEALEALGGGGDAWGGYALGCASLY